MLPIHHHLPTAQLAPGRPPARPPARHGPARPGPRQPAAREDQPPTDHNRHRSEASTRAEFLKQGMAAAAAVAAAAAPAMAAVEEVETPVNYGKNPGAIANRRSGTAGAKTEIKKFNNNKVRRVTTPTLLDHSSTTPPPIPPHHHHPTTTTVDWQRGLDLQEIGS